MKIFEILQTFIILSQAKLDGLTTEEKHKVINIARALKKYVTDFEDFIKETQEKVSDTKEANKIIEAEANKVIDETFEKLGDTFDKLFEHNSWNVAQTMLLEDVLK